MVIKVNDKLVEAFRKGILSANEIYKLGLSVLNQAVGNAMRISDKGLKKLAELEGLRQEVYDDVAGLPTIGIGHLLTRDELSSGKIDIYGVSVKYKDGLTVDQCYDLFRQDLQGPEGAIQILVRVPLTQGQYDSLVSFAYNIGGSSFRRSTLLKKLNKGEYEEVPAQLRRWKYAGGKVIQGLVNRREAEVEMWNAINV